MLKKTLSEKANIRKKLILFAKLTFSKTDMFSQSLFYNFVKTVLKVLLYFYQTAKFL